MRARVRVSVRVTASTASSCSLHAARCTRLQMRYSLLGTVASLKTSLGGSGGAASDEDILRWAREKVPPAQQPEPEPYP